ncbi:MAG: flavin reductase family protein [Hyphomicrobiales bacterium]|jgi:flavin reductase (DIM6/NTAB) family NADH-FMN oxidoreductase RutF|nr:flavin reductase family protein [Hyphomicrobiales bacterium]
MHYSPANRDRALLPHDPLKAIVAPRPIGWISALSARGELNLSPYSFFNLISSPPTPIVMFASEGKKDAVSFVAETGEFTCSLATFDMAQQMSLTSAPLPRGQSEYPFAGLETAPSVIVKPPRVKGTPAALECKLLSITELNDLDGRRIDRFMVLGQVVSVYVDERFVFDGKFDIVAARTIARCGYADYSVVDSIFSIERPPGG